MQFAKEREKNLIATATFGVSYDSNIILASDTVNSQGTSTDEAGARLPFAGSFQYRPIYDRHREMSVIFNGSYTYSLNDDHAIYDPGVGNISVPYTINGTMGAKAYRLTFKPAYEVLYMQPSNDDSYQNIQSSPLLNTNLTIIMSNDWFASYVLEVRQDDSLLASAVGNEDGDATMFTISTSQSFYFDTAKKRGFTANGGFIINSAKGDNKTYNRIDLGGTYQSTFKKWDASWYFSLATYKLDYPDHTNSREDTNVSVTFGVTKPFSEAWSLVNSVNYTNNQSTEDASQYSKYTAGVALAYAWNN